MDPFAISSYAAMKKGVCMSITAGNSGPSLGSLYNRIPWVLTVGASSIYHSLAGTVTLGNGSTITGWTMFPASALVHEQLLIYNKTLSHCNSSGWLSNPPYDGILVCDVGIVKSFRHIAPLTTSAIFICNDPQLAEVEEFSYPRVVIGSKVIEVVINYAKRSKKPMHLQIASPLANGGRAGQVNPNKALDSDLIYDTTPHGHVNLLCSMNFTSTQILTIVKSRSYNYSNPSDDLNYPSFIVLYTNKTTMISRTFQRAVTSVGDGPTIYKAEVTTSEHSTIFVWPEEISFVKKYEKQSYNMTIKYIKEKNGTVEYGSLV
ncbi:subtilisin-like protease SBT3 [Cornus florida]|uniref:subtilisin-like protease SBT3 n=1 Tax=Cornus florida TaxID=4283 RepID=UPI0028A0D979|nr:subtilisin-like protease SBT3 [Cornus florida]